MKVGVVSLGCAKNRVDTEHMLHLLVQDGFLLTSQPEEADVLVVNTCGFIEPAKEESIRTILELAEYKETGECRVLCVTGCLTQRYGQEIASDMPEIDVLTGISSYEQLPELIRKALDGTRGLDTTRRAPLEHCGRILTTPPYSAYIRIAEGCDNRCAYCAIPLIRGGFVGRRQQDILDEMRTLAQNGVREQILIAQDTTRYGRGTQNTLASLIQEAAAIPGIDWLRLLYCYPDETDQQLIDEMAAHSNVCRYIDLPLQHASPRILKSMNRRGDIAHTVQLLEYARAKGFALRTTFIVGFPGETEEDFEQLMDFAARMRFDRMGAFAFSPEEDTSTATLPNQVPEDIKAQRLDRLMRQQADISREQNEQRVGTTARVLVTNASNGMYTGRSEYEAPDADGLIHFTSAQPVAVGTFADVRIDRADTYDLFGTCIGREKTL